MLTFHLWLLPGLHTSLWIDEFVSNAFSVGWMGVDLFFVLSGFLITGILLDAKSSDGFFKNFYARRFLRIFPLYYGFLFVLIVLVPLLPAYRDDETLRNLRHYQVWYWAYAYNILAAANALHELGSGWAGHLWSLAVEEQFYLVWPAIVFLSGRRSLTAVCLICIAAAPVLRYAILVDAIPGVSTAIASDVLAPARADSLAMGALLALAVREREAIARYSRFAPVVFVLAAALFIGILFQQRDPSPFNDVVQVAGLSSIALGCGALTMMALVARHPSALAGLLVQPALTFLGRYSYGLYVLHYPIALQLALRVHRNGPLPTVAGSDIPAHILFVFVAGSMSLTAAWLSWHLYEKQFLKLKRYFPYRPEAPPPVRGDEAPETALASP